MTSTARRLAARTLFLALAAFGLGGLSCAGATLSPDADINRLPSEVRVPYTEQNGGVALDCTLNGRPIKLLLDTGASSTAVGANQLSEMGLTSTPGINQFETGGVGSSNGIKSWMQQMSLGIGPIYKRNCPVTVHEYMPADSGLLGQNFLGYFDVSVDKSNHQVVFRKKTATASYNVMPRGTVDVPFTQSPDGHLFVTAQVNNQPVVFCFDTGADTVCFTTAQLKRLHLDPADGVADGMATGVGGATQAWKLQVSKLRLGNIARDDFPVSFVEQAAMDHPLLGRSFWEGYDYKVDRAKQVIHFIPLR